MESVNSRGCVAPMRRPVFWPGRKAFSSCGLLALLAASLALGAGCSKSSAPKPPAGGRPPMIVPVRVATATQEDVPEQVTTIGNCEALSTVSVKSMVNGQILQAHFVEGQEVQTGDLLFSIDRRPFEAVLKQAEANLVRSQALARNAALEAGRAAELLKSASISQQQFDLAQATQAATQAAVLADQATAENARIQLDYCTIRSPIRSRTGPLLVHPGNLIKANDAAMVVLHQTRPIRVSFSVPEKHFTSIRQGMARGLVPVTATPAGSDPEPGRLDFIENSMDTATGTLPLVAVFTNAAERLWPGQFVHVTMTLAMRPNAVTIPAQAVETGQRGPYVFVLQTDSTVAFRLVTLGSAAGDRLVIEKGVLADERVVTDGQLQLMNGSKVEIKSDAPKAPGATPAAPATEKAGK